MSNRSRYSKYSARGKSLVTQRAKENKLENIEENDEINYENSPRCTVCDNELTKEEFTFNKQIVSYKQGRVYENNYEVKENQEKLEEVGKTIAENNLKKSNNVKVETASPDPFLCAKCMYELYMSQGIVPQTSPNDAEPTKLRLNSETRNNKMLTNEELDRKIQKEMIIAQHLGNNTPSNAIKLKPNLISVAQRTFAGNSYKPTILPKLNNLKSNFSEMTGATAMIEQRDQDLERALRNFQNVLSKSMVDPDEIYDKIKDIKPNFPVPTSKEEHGWAPFQNMRVDRHFHRKKNDISVFSDAKFKGGVFHLSSLDLPRRPNTSEKFL